MYFEALRMKMKRNPYRCCFVSEILAKKNHYKTGAKYIGVNVKPFSNTTVWHLFDIFSKMAPVNYLKNECYFR